MSSIKKTRMVKAGLWVSGMAFLFLIVADRRPSLCAACIAAGLWGGVLLKSPVTCEKLKSSFKPVYAVFGFGLCGLLGLNFYNRWMSSGKAQILSSWFRIGQDRLVLMCTVAVVLAAALLVSVCLSFFVSAAVRDFREKREADSSARDSFKRISIQNALIAVMAAYAVGIIAILRANFNYIDDMGRAAVGTRGWTNFSRFLTEALSVFIHMDNYLTDISPLPQLIAVFILAVSGILLLYVIQERTCFSLWELVALIPLGLNPYFLECISYKYDSPYMALSILGAVMPFLYRKKSCVSYIFASMVGMVVVCTTYQAATGIYPMIVILLMLKMWCDREPVRKIGGFCLRSAAGYGLGLAFFCFVLMVPLDSEYVESPAMGTGIGDLLQIIYFNLRTYYETVKADFKLFWIILIVILAAGFLWTTARSSKRNVFLTAAVAAAGLVLMGFVCFGVYPALPHPLFAPRAMYGFGVLITLAGICTMEKCAGILLKVPMLLLSLAFFVFSFTYGNALYVQKEYTDFRIQMVIEDLNDMDVFLSDRPVVVQISGTIGYSPVISNMPQNYYVLDRLIPITFQGGWQWGQAGFYWYYGLKNVIRDPSVDLTTYELPVLEDKMYHTIRGRDNYILIELK